MMSEESVAGTLISELSYKTKSRPFILTAFGALGTLQFAGIILFIWYRLVPEPSQWQNPDYAKDNAFAYYFVHCILCIVWMALIGPLLLSKHFQSQWFSLYWSFWFVSAIVTAIPLLPVNKSKQIFGTAAYLASGVFGNAFQVVFAAQLFFDLFRTPKLAKAEPSEDPSVNSALVPVEHSKYAVRRVDYLAFHLLCGFNYELMSFKYDMVTLSQEALAAVMYIILFLHLGLIIYLRLYWEGRTQSPVRQRLSAEPGVWNEIKAYGRNVIFVNLAIDLAFILTSAFFFINRGN